MRSKRALFLTLSELIQFNYRVHESYFGGFIEAIPCRASVDGLFLTLYQELQIQFQAIGILQMAHFHVSGCNIDNRSYVILRCINTRQANVLETILNRESFQAEARCSIEQHEVWVEVSHYRSEGQP
jgi:hypothetical protein